MIKFVNVFRFPAGADKEATRRYWLDQHAPMVRDRLPELMKYVISIPHAGPDGTEPPYDGIVEMHFEDLDAMRRSFATEPWLRKDRIDSSARLMDSATALRFHTEEHVTVLAAPAAPGKRKG